MGKINDMVKDAHETAVQHGWWDKPPEFGTLIALCHSELSEALEEYRKGKEPTETYYRGHVMDRDILEIKEKARTDMARCDIPCRMTAPNKFMAQMEKERKDQYFI